ncbi:DUF6531 domain-containing protein [Tepidibacillus decaturensis]|uniref:DUF6531 domain-containing protein n=1 Tax=Tepidibacillus decaturensis TaxID=1413211 RepID=UPI00137AA095|nr:DUF6531 domain-containing protein [Tepidibacillus decaturensis]
MKFSEKELNLPGIGYDFVVERAYSSNDQEVGPFGRGWKYPLDSKLHKQQITATI